jgi:ribulose-phosphate 3-epimerase
MDVSGLVSRLADSTPLVVPSMLAADFAHLGREVEALEEAGAEVFHLDVMDGHFVPNLSFGIPVVKAIRRSTELPLDVHLMIARPERYLEVFRDAGADLLTIHVEAVENPGPLLREIHRLGAAAGLSLNPPTPIEAVQPYLEECDLILSMSVMPGFGGQDFQAVALEKLRRLRKLAGPKKLLSVDGGVNLKTIRSCAEAGANYFITGTALLGIADYRTRFEQLLHLAKSGTNGQGQPR